MSNELMIRPSPDLPSATRLAAPQSDNVYQARLIGEMSLSVPGYSGAGAAGIMTSWSLRDNGVFVESCPGIGFAIDFSSGDWKKLLASGSLKPNAAVGATWGEPRKELYQNEVSNEFSMPFFTASFSDGGNEWAWKLSPSISFGAQRTSCGSLYVTPRTLANEFDNLTEGFNENAFRIYNEFLFFVFESNPFIEY
jgi:hypothetical protein